MRRNSIQGVLMGVGLGVLLTVGAGAWGVAAAAQPAPAQTYTGQVREITINQCGLEPGSCEGSLVLAQARGQAVDLAIPAGTAIQRGGHRVHLEELGVGNYVMVQAIPSHPYRKGTAGIGPGTKSIGTSIVRSTAAPKGIERGVHPAHGLDRGGGPPRLPGERHQDTRAIQATFQERRAVR
jgi:hypothetical protein